MSTVRPTLIALLCAIARCLSAEDAAALPPEAQKIADKAEAAIAAVIAATDAQVGKLKSQEAKDLQRLLDAALKKKDQAVADLIKQRLDAVGADATDGTGGAKAGSGGTLGSPGFHPSPDHPIGWRGDGSGRYPGATPPTSWSSKRGGESKNIIWTATLPNVGVSMPIIVGDRIFLTTEPCDLVCLDKKSGSVLWIRSNMEFEGLSKDDRKDSAVYAEKLDPLLPQLAQANEAAVAALNSQKDAAGGSMGRKRELEKQIYDLQLSIDKKKFERYWAQAMFGFAGPTATSDGKHVCAFYTTGVAACYDLNGNRKWIARGPGGGAEHGNFASPVLGANRMVVWANEMRAYDVETGKVAWSNPAKGNNSYGSCFRLQLGGDLVAGFQFGWFNRISDGKAIWGDGIFGDAVATPIVEGEILYADVGYPRNSEGLGFKAFKIPSTTDGKPSPAFTFKTEWAADEVPVEDKKAPFNRGFVASPLLVDGLIYRMTEGGGLIVNDAATGAMLYRKVLPMQPKTEYWGWAGAATSPTLAGKYIYLMDNQGTTIVIQPGPQYKQVASNAIEVSRSGKDLEQNVSTPIFEGTRMYYRTPSALYCIGEK
jgi:outer membrane protein assembly factor BamB